jgi:predicted 3-demethylubiquinone-9 3-methyltransferase (glyoxalase superfamily)
MNKITPFLWFDDDAEEAVSFYVSVFKNAKLGALHRYGEGSPKPGSVLTASFEIEGQPFMAINGGPHYKLTPAISLYVDCGTQAEVDALWDKLSAGGEVLACGWVTDKFGLTWQVVPSGFREMLEEGDPEKSRRVWQAMMKMKKLDLAALQAAYDGA